MSVLTSSQIVEDVRLVRAITYSSYALLLWDYLLTLDDEMTYIWESPCSIVKYFFVGNRYVNLLVQPLSISQVAGVLPLHSTPACLAFSWAMALSQLWSYGSVHLLVLLRIWILYGRSRKVTVALITLLMFYLCACFALLIYMFGATTFNLNATPAVTCGGELAPFSWLIWMIEFLLEICLFVLTIFTLRQQKLSASEFSRISRLVRGLYRHAIIFLLANAFGDILNTISWTILLRTPLHHLPNTFPTALVNIIGQRLAIDLRRLHVQKDVTQSEVSREVELQLAAFDDDDPGVP